MNVESKYEKYATVKVVAECTKSFLKELEKKPINSFELGGF